MGLVKAEFPYEAHQEKQGPSGTKQGDQPEGDHGDIQKGQKKGDHGAEEKTVEVKIPKEESGK